MALTLNTPYKTNTLASVSGVTFTSNGTPFVAGDVGRFLVFTNGPAIGQIRRIVGYTSSSVVTVDLAWNVSQISAFTDSLPAAGNTWQMSLTLDDIDDGSHIIKDSANSYRWISDAGVVTLTDVFLADVSKNITWNSAYIRLGTGARICLGYIAPGGYGIYGCSMIDLLTISDGFSAAGSSGDVHLYGCNVSVSTVDSPFWRLYRGNDQIVRFVDCDLSGNFAGRVQGTRSALVRCTYRGSTSLAPFGGIAAISAFGLISECKVQAAYNAIYCSYAQGVGTVISLTLDAISGRIFASLNASPTGGTFIIEDYVESQVTAAPYVVVCAITVADAYLSFRQWVSGSIVNAALVAITDSARRVIRNGAAVVVDNVTTVSGTFTRYTAEVKKFSMVAGNMAWSAGTAYGPYEEAISSYLYQPQVLSLPLATSSNVQFTMLSDLNVTQTTKATVDAYTLISSADRLYDRYKSWFVDNLATVWPTFGIQRLNGSGDTLLLGSTALTIDATAVTVFNPTPGSNLLAIKATAFSAGTKFQFIQSTSGSITLANAAAISCGVDLDGANLIAQDIDAVTGAITTTGTCRIDVAAPGVYPAAAINATSKIRVTAATSGDVHDCQAVVFTSGAVFENNSGQPITVLLAAGATQPTKLETSGTITYSQPTEDLTVTSNESGTLLQVFTTGTQTVLASTTGTTLAYTHSSNTVDIVAQKAGFLPQRVTGVALSGDKTQAFTLQPDYNYDAAHGLVYTTDASWASNQLTVPSWSATRTVQKVYSLIIDAFISQTALRNTAFNLSMNGPTTLLLTNGAEGASDASITNMTGGGVRYLSGAGATTAEFSGVQSSGVVSGSQPEYELGAGGTIVDTRATGDVNQIIKGYGDAAHGNFDKRAHLQFKVQRNGYRQAEYDVVATYGNLDPVLYIITLPMQAIDGLTLGDPGITGVTVTHHLTPVSWDAGDGAKDYSITIEDSGTNSGQDILEWLNYNLSLDAVFQGKEPFYWPEMVLDNGAKFETLLGIVHANPDVTSGVRVIRTGGDPHPDFTRFQADDGTYGTPPIISTASIGGILTGPKVRVYNVTTDTETYIGTPGTSYSFEYLDGSTYTNGDVINVRIHKRGYLTFETTLVASVSGWTVSASQLEDEVYTALAIDGSAVTGFAADYVNDEVNVTVAANFNVSDMYAWWSYNLESDDGIREFVGGMTGLDIGNFRINNATVNIYLDNTTATNLRQLDNRRIFRADDAYPVKSSGGGGIDVVWRNTVLLAETGVSGLTEQEAAQLASITTVAEDVIDLLPLSKIVGTTVVPLK